MSDTAFSGSARPVLALPSRILVSTDFSPASEYAVDYALALAKKLSASVQLCHCTLQPDYELAGLVSPGMRTAAAAFIEKAMEMAHASQVELEALAASKSDQGVPLTIKMLEGQPSEAIVAAAREWSAELIVIGSRSRPGVRHLLLGSVAEHVMRAAHCPVLIVHPDDRPGQ